MLFRFKVLMASLATVLALSAVLAAAAQAKRPEQPLYERKGGTIGEGVGFESSSGASRTWAPALGMVITCKKSEGAGNDETIGAGWEDIYYKECGVFEATENKTTKQYEEGAEFSACTIKGGEEAATREISVENLKSKLVWDKGENLVLNRYEPESKTLVELEVAGSGCLLKGKYKEEGSLLAWLPNTSSEVVQVGNPIMDNEAFEVKDEKGEVVPRFTKWEDEQAGKKEEGTTELKFGAKPVVFEAVKQDIVRGFNIAFAWKVGNATLGAGGESSLTEIKNEGNISFGGRVSGAPYTVACTELKANATTPVPKILGGIPGRGKEKLELEHCTVSSPAGCEVTGGKIVTSELNDEIVEGMGRSFPKILLLFDGVFPITIGPITCSVAGTHDATGSLLAEAELPKMEAENQQFRFEPVMGRNARSVAHDDTQAGLRADDNFLTVTGYIVLKKTVNFGPF
jgi:hypothetical protein